MSNHNFMTQQTLQSKVKIFECRLCGNIITFSDGVERHQKVCRLNDGLNNLIFEQMVTVDFPCPIVTIEKMPLPPEQISNWKRIPNPVPVKTDITDIIPRLRRKSKLLASKLDPEANSDDSNSISDDDESRDEDGSEYTDSDDIIENDKKCTTGKRNDNKDKYSSDKSSIFKCPFKGCGATFTNRIYRLREHFVIHLENNPFKCLIPGCNVVFSSQWRLDKHLKHHSKSKSLSRCQNCGLSYITKQKSLHTCPKGQSQGNSDSTRSKSRSYTSKVSLDIKDLIASDPVFHKVCEETPSFKEIIVGGVCRGSSLNGTHKCPHKLCKSVLSNVRSLRKHFITHLANNPYACPIPGCRSKSEAYCHLIKHLHWHMGKTRLQCPKCKETYCDKAKLRDHKCRGRGAGDRPFPYINKNNMSSKEINEYLEARLEKLKSQGFYQPSSNSEERRSEFGLIMINPKDIKILKIVEADPVFLEVCKENPNFRHLMITGRYSHKKVRKTNPKSKVSLTNGSCEKYKCGRCSRTFRSKRTLKNHHWEMHQVHPYKCEQCNWGFAMKHSLKVHMKFHNLTENRIYMRKLDSGKWACGECEAEFSYNYSLRKHLDYSHNIKITLKGGKEELQSKIKSKCSDRDIKLKTSPLSKYSNVDVDLDNVVKYEDSEEFFHGSSPPIVRIKSEPAVQLAMISGPEMKTENSLEM